MPKLIVMVCLLINLLVAGWDITKALFRQLVLSDVFFNGWFQDGFPQSFLINFPNGNEVETTGMGLDIGKAVVETLWTGGLKLARGVVQVGTGGVGKKDDVEEGGEEFADIEDDGEDLMAEVEEMLKNAEI
jgi:hypothetical protein